MREAGHGGIAKTPVPLFDSAMFGRWFLLVLMLGPRMLGACNANDHTPPEHINADLLTELYDTVVFERDFKGPPARLLKWLGPIRYRLDYDPQWTGLAQRSRNHLRLLGEITGLDIREAENGAYNFYVYIGPRTDFRHHLRRGTPLHKEHDRVRCFAQLRTTDAGWIWTARVGIGTDQDTKIVSSCIVEELTQALGLLADTNLIRPSVFNDMLYGSPVLMWHDEIIVRAHYDPRMRPGMTRRLAGHNVWKIIAELIAQRGPRRRLAPTGRPSWRQRHPRQGRLRILCY